MSAILEDLNGEFHLGNKFTLDTATELSKLLTDNYRIILKYQGQSLPEPWNDDKLNIVVNTSRETHDPPEEILRDDVFLIFQHYYMCDTWDLPWHNPWVCPMPLGPFVDTTNIDHIKPMPERKYDFSFIGQIPHTGTRDCFKRNLDNLMRDTGDKFKYFVEYTDGYSKGLGPSEYLELLGDSRIVLCPAGAHTVETFRMFEAILMGAMPANEYLPRVWYYENLPRLRTRWSSLDTTLSIGLNLLQTERSRDILYSIAEYSQTILQPAWLAGQMKEQIKMRHANFDTVQPQLEMFRQQVRERHLQQRQVIK